MTKSKTLYHNVEGTIKWAKVYEADEYGGVEFYIIDLYLNENELKKYNALGLSNKIYTDQDGNSYVRPRRVRYKEFGRIPNKTYIEQLPPQIFDKDFNPVRVFARHKDGKPDFGDLRNFVRYFDMNEKPEFTEGPQTDQRLIGNGSKVRVNISSYPIQGGTARASQLESITVLDWIDFTPDGGQRSDSPNSPDGAPKDDTPKGNGAAYEFPPKVDIDDDIPF